MTLNIGTLTAQESETFDPAIPRKSPSGLETICGPIDDSQNVETYDGTLGPSVAFVMAEQASVAQLQWNDDLAQVYSGQGESAGNIENGRWCSGARIGADLFLTAAHCVDVYEVGNPTGWITPSRMTGGVRVYEKPKELSKLLHLNFNYQRTKEPPHDIRTPDVYPIVDLVEYGHELPTVEGRRLDYAILRIGKDISGSLPSMSKYPPNDLDASKATLLATSFVTIPQHPDGEPKKVEAGPIKGTPGILIKYADLDTLGGSSGSPIINDAGRIVGVHIAGGCELATQRANTGVSLWAISQISTIVQ